VHTPATPRKGYEFRLVDAPDPPGPPASWPLLALVRRYAHLPIIQRPWIKACFVARRALTEQEDWGGWRGM
jgi:hypothetical protein